MFLWLAACTGIQSVPDLKLDSADTGATTGTVVDGDLEVSPGRLDFGEVDVGGGRERDLTIRYLGEGSTPIHLELDGDAFTVNTTTLDLEGESVVSVGFQPQAARDYEGTLTVDGGDAGRAEIRLAGVGGGGGGDDTGTGGTTVTGGPDVDLSATSWDFGQVDVGSAPGQYSFVFYNRGDEDLLISGIQFDNGVFSNGGGSLQVPQVLSPGSNRVLTVNFAPTQARAYSGEMTVLSDDPDEPNLRVQLDGEGVDLCDICSPILEADVVALDYYIVTLFGRTSTQSVSVSNVGDQDLEVRRVNISNDIIATCGTFTSNFRNSQTLRPGATTSFDVTWSVTGSCLDIGYVDMNVLEIESNDPSSPWVIALTGTAIEF